MNSQSLPDRRWDIDWLRLLVVLGMLVPFHAFRLFDTRDPFYVKNSPQSAALNWYLILGDSIGMQLLFMLAGAAAWYSLRHASAGRFAWQRARRLLVPLCTGLVLVVPPQLYLAARFNGFSGSFVDWLPAYFRFDPEQLAGWTGATWSPTHLWFILYLFVISLVALPIFMLLRTRPGHRLAALAATAHLPGAILLVPVVLAAVAYLGEASYPFYILHQTVIVGLGYYILPSSLPVAVEYLLVVALTYFFTLALYDVAVRRTNVTRFLFGMKPRPVAQPPGPAMA